MIVETVDIVRDLVENINLKLNIKTVSTNGDLHTITVCDTLYLSGKSSTNSNPFQVTIDSNEYNIISVDGDTIVLQGSEPITKGLKSIASPYFFHGTVTQTNNELSDIGDVFQKTPMIYFRRTFTENWSRYTSVERTAEITLFFLTQADFNTWQINDYDAYAIKPMRNLCYKFIDSLLINKQIGKIENYSIIDNIKFATFVTEKGYENQKFNDTLSGVQLDISLPIRKNYHCNC